MIERGEVAFPIRYRVLLGAGAVTLIGVWLLNSYLGDKYKNTGNTNVYLGEEACFADEIFVSADSINVFKNELEEKNVDDDGDSLSEYTLNLGLTIEQRHTDWWTNKVTIKPSCFKLKSINLKARSKMSVFFECLAKETLSIMIGGAIEGSINVIEETINYAADYTLASIENVQNSKADFKPIRCRKDSFKPFSPYKVRGKTHIDLSFPIKEEYLESDNLIALAIDDISHVEKRIFLITRPDPSDTNGIN